MALLRVIALAIVVTAYSALQTVFGLEMPAPLKDKNVTHCEKTYELFGNKFCERQSFQDTCACTCNDVCRQNQQRIRQCCRSFGVKESCMKNCRYDCNYKELLCEGRCAGNIEPWVYCAANKRNSRQCCADAGLPEQCLGFCDGRTPPDLFVGFTYLPCLINIDTILNCERISNMRSEDPDFNGFVNSDPIHSIVPEYIISSSERFCNRSASTLNNL